MRVSYHELHNVLRNALARLGFESERGELCARLFAETSRDGVASHAEPSCRCLAAMTYAASLRAMLPQSRRPAGRCVRYPGERTLETRRRNMEEGVPVDPEIWEAVLGMS
jgi:LDH2 family malate/lactate/ureidoglycolate dehydrogenase